MDGQPEPENQPNWQYKDGDSAEPQASETSPQSDSASVAREQVAAVQQQTENHNAVVSESASDEPQAASPENQSDNGQVQWTASEFIARHKPAGWYLALAGITAVLAAIIYFSGHDYIAMAAVIIIAVIFGVIAARKPRSLNYRLDNHGLSVASKLYPYGHFKAFSIAREDAFSSLNFLPLKRFMPVLTVYYDPADEEAITTIIGDYLPLENRRIDPIDKLLHKIHF